MNKPLQEQFSQAYKDLDLFPLITEEQIEAFRVDFAQDTLKKLSVVAKTAADNAKIIFTGHKGCGKSTLLFKFAEKMEETGDYVVAFFSVADLI